MIGLKKFIKIIVGYDIIKEAGHLLTVVIVMNVIKEWFGQFWLFLFFTSAIDLDNTQTESLSCNTFNKLICLKIKIVHKKPC